MLLNLLLVGALTLGLHDSVAAAPPPTGDGQNGMLKRQIFTDNNYTGPQYQAYNISLPIDHFNTSDHRTFQSRYWVNDTYYEEGGPVIWYDVGEGGITDSTVFQWLGESDETTAVMELARQLRGLAILPEHRYYGFSLPFPLNITERTAWREPVDVPETWQYNTLDQGIQDAAYLATNFAEGDYQRDNMEALLPRNTPWIFLGGSYSGVRAANMRARIPEVFYAAWSSSAPVEGQCDGSSMYGGCELSLFSNCSADTRALVKYADEVMSGDHGPEAYSHLSSLAYAAVFASLPSYNASFGASLIPNSIASYMSYPFSGFFTMLGARNTTWIFCNGFQTYNPEAQGSNTTDYFTSIVTNPGDAEPSDEGFLATHNNNLTLGLEAYLFGIAKYTAFDHTGRATPRASGSQGADGAADASAWDYMSLTQSGVYAGSNPANISIVSKFENYTYQREQRLRLSVSPATLAVIPECPNTTAWNAYGGWNMNPSNVMFTAGAWDPWGAMSVYSADVENGAPGLRPSEQVPTCGTTLEDLNLRFGVVYPEAVHVPDMGATERVYGTGPDTPFNRGVALFIEALDAWLPCFGNGTYSVPTT